MARPLDLEPTYESQSFIPLRVRFAQYSQGSTIRETGYRNLPNAAVELFEGYNERFMSPVQYTRKDFHALFGILHPDGSESWAALQTRLMTANWAIENLVYLIDVDSNDATEVGHAEMRYAINGRDRFFTEKPFDGCSLTLEPHRRKGLGRRRLIIMNALAQMLYQLPLHSDTIHDLDSQDDTRGMWRNLENLGLAVPVRHKGQLRFVFVQDHQKYVIKNA